MVNALSLQWSLQVDPNQADLSLSYTVSNNGTSPVLIADQMVVLGAKQGYDLALAAVVVRPDATDAHVVHLSKGWVEPYGDPRIEILPGVRELAPGASLTGGATVAMPLQAWHPNDAHSDLSTGPTSVVLEVGVLPTDAPTRDWPTNSGVQQRSLTPAALAQQQWLRGGPKAI